MRLDLSAAAAGRARVEYAARMSEFPPRALTTQRALLRPPREDDAEAIFAYASDPAVCRYVGFPRHTSVEDARGFVEMAAAGWRGENPMRPYVVELRATGEVVGATGYELAHGASIGYVLAPRMWGQGLATEIARAQVEAARQAPSIFRVWALCDAEHGASARVMEKAGLLREGVLRRWAVHPNLGPEPRDCVVYALARPQDTQE